MNNREHTEQQELESLAPYAMKAANSKGRVYPQPEHPLRTAFQRDRDRIVHSTAFRRMEYKTQVFLPHEGDHIRTRLTHSIEVAQISRTMARCLGLNEDLTEAIALVHDLGHTPFGHAGEDVLNELLADQGGFNHNRQSLRVVDILEHHYPDYPGLNLSYEVREGIVKHETKTVVVHPDFDLSERTTLEASLVDIADEIAYNAHDIDDGLRAGLINLSEVTELSIWLLSDEQKNPELSRNLSDGQLRYALVRLLVNSVVSDVLDETTKRIKLFGVVDLKSLRACPERPCKYSDSLLPAVRELKAFLREKLYLHPSLQKRSKRAEEIIKTLFEKLSAQPELMPERYIKMMSSEKSEIVIADYIAGMTDRLAEKIWHDIK